MAIDISAQTRRVVYTGSAGVGPYAFAFNILVNTDIAVYFNTTELTLTTDYSVSISADGTGSVTLVVNPGGNIPATPDADDRVTLVGDRTIQRTTDFTTGGPLFATSLNDELDSLTIFTQQNLEQSNRSLRAPNTDPTTINMELPNNTTRANKTLAFDADGNPVIGELIGDWTGNWAAATVYNKRDLIKDTSNSNVYICIVAHTSSGAQPISTNTDVAKWALVVDAAAAGAAQAAAEAAQAAAETAETNAETAETNAETAQTAAETAETNAETAETNAETAETNAATSETNAATSETNAATSETNAATSETNAATSETNAATSASNASTSASTATTQASNASTSASNASTSETNAGTSETNAGTSASNASTSASNASTSETNAATSANEAAASADAFDDVYLGSKSSDPTVDNDGDALAAGMLYYNTASNIMRIYSGSVWENVAVSTSGFATLTGVETLTNKTLTSPKINEDVVVTSTATELNILDGVTSTTTELNKLDALSRGSIIYGNASAATTVLTKGTVGQVLTSDGTDISWDDISGGTSWQSVKTSGFTAIAGEGYPCNTASSAFTVTLPSSASIGDFVVIADYGNNSSTNNITIDPNGSKILGTSGNRKIQTNKETIELTYVDATKGWIATTGYVEGTLGLQGVPDAPTIGTATQTGSTTATVVFTAPANNGDATITSYTSTSSPGGVTNTLSQAGSGTISVTGLTAATSYTFTVTATNSIGTSVASSASNSITTTNTYSADFLVIAGGASGAASGNGGGGGAGGYRTSTQTVNGGTVITVTVGDGGASVGGGGHLAGNNGSNSSISGSGLTTITSAGGGGGAVYNSNGNSGGSGGGGGYSGGSGGAGNTPSTSPSQGYAGGNGSGETAPAYGGGGGGGAGAVGQVGTSSKGGDGGAGTASSITGSSVTRAGGGGGASNSTIGSGGAGGGGNGGAHPSGNANAGTVNTGSGGGACQNNSNSGAGGKGVVILSMPDASYSGTTTGSPTVATGVSGKTILSFTGTGSYTA